MGKKDLRASRTGGRNYKRSQLHRLKRRKATESDNLLIEEFGKNWS